ncbi:hypothetical protein [Noviherbaspirillum pedocola]|uniref:Uncharacterized protein n=1 Tax=Noviherbaspirillum pedocola TaxID=2801341 RepID=A0A934SV30_9BURK|nr:hypothetical protein [Noviherbaspirillum pedocola]MBK4737341.1 hypothetical protein [Noviherbaspirillum pedocola]
MTAEELNGELSHIGRLQIRYHWQTHGTECFVPIARLLHPVNAPTEVDCVPAISNCYFEQISRNKALLEGYELVINELVGTVHYYRQTWELYLLD